MTWLPIVERELRQRARRRSTYRFRLGGAVLAIAITGCFLAFNEGVAAPGAVGSGLFLTLAWLAFLYCLFEGARNTADCLSEEKRAGTLGLLFLTDLKGYDVVLGKLMATSLNSVYALLAIFPPLAIPLFIGGVTAGEFWRLALALLAVLFFSLTTGLVVSAASRHERRAWTVTLVLLLGLALVPPLLELTPWTRGIFLRHFSPTWVFLMSFHTHYTNDAGEFWSAILGLHLLSWIFLMAASVILPRSWRDRPPRIRPARRPGRRSDAARGETLSGNPVLWLAGRSEEQRVYLWLLWIVAGVGAVGAWWLGGGSTAVGLALLLLGLALHLVLALWVAAQACHAFAEARDSGALELLLSTPLTVNEILAGYFLAMRRLFWWPALTLVLMEVTLLGAHTYLVAAGGGEFSAGAIFSVPAALFLIVAVMDLFAVAQFGLWMGLSTRKPSQAILRTVLCVLVLPMIGGLCCGFLWPIMGVVKNLIFISYAREQLRKNFRTLVTERFAVGATDEIIPAAKPLPPPHLPPVLPP